MGIFFKIKNRKNAKPRLTVSTPVEYDQFSIARERLRVCQNENNGFKENITKSLNSLKKCEKKLQRQTKHLTHWDNRIKIANKLNSPNLIKTLSKKRASEVEEVERIQLITMKLTEEYELNLEKYEDGKKKQKILGVSITNAELGVKYVEAIANPKDDRR